MSSVNTSSNSLNPARAAELMQLLAENGDKRAFAEIYAHFAPRVKGFIMKGGASPEEAEDLAQDTMVKVFQKAKLFNKNKASAATWIFTIARNARIDAIRRASRPTPEAEDLGHIPEDVPRADDLCELKERNARITEALQKLPPEQRDVMRLHFYDDEPHAIIAKRLNLPLGTVKSRLRLAFEKVRVELGYEI